MTLLGTIIGVGAVIAVLSFVEGMNRFVSDKLIQAGSNVFVVDKWGLITTQEEYEDAKDRPRITLEDADALEVGYLLCNVRRMPWLGKVGRPDRVLAVYDVVRGNLASLSESPDGIDLGMLTCIESDSVDTTTTGNEDIAVPSVGTGFFYLVRFELGHSVGGYGRGSTSAERTGTGGCPP